VKHFYRWLFNGFAAISLLLFVAVAVMWARSYLWGDAVDWKRGNAVLEIRSGAGHIALQRSPWFSGNFPNGSFRRWSEALVQTERQQERDIISGDVEFWDRWMWQPQREIRFLGFTLSWAKGLTVQNWPGAHVFWSVETPYWFWLMVAAVAPGAKLLGWRLRLNQIKKGVCVNCGYDLRATPDKCPECGTIPPKKEIVSN
jgi:hypothetical protein